MSGFLQTAAGENSSTKLFNLLYGVALVCVWAGLCWYKKEIVQIDMATIAPLGMGQAANSLNKWIEVNGNTEKAKFIKAIMNKVVKK